MSSSTSDVAPLGMTTILVILFFGTNFFLYLIFQAIKFTSKPSVDNLEKNSDKEKKLSKPFMGTIECFTNITSELFRTGLIMALTYICERHWFFEHSTKSYSRDLFLFVLILFFGYAFYTIKPITDLSLLGREQTEEWKGWMQFIFLLYHYFHAEEVYNSVRVMISCYVWMTGFGNFSFFYMKKDFGWLRVAQMMWRLNFSVLLLMLTHSGNTWILYYIAPMHTFYFVMVYLTMYAYSSLNLTKWGIRWKLFAVGVIIYIIWDINGGLFDILFAWLGTDSIIGAKNGAVWEYYFRTSLDHWSTFFGMIFALNFPLAEQFFVKARGWPLVLTAVVMGSLTLWWLIEIYPLQKLTYNLTHAYYTIIPLTSYIFFRNITPAIRSGVSMSLHDLGKTTLETYLLQHHIWLTSNAKTLLTLTPGHPWINFALATMLFFVVSKELYRLTMSLRGMVLPDDQVIAWRNLTGMGVIFCVYYLSAMVVSAFSPTLLEITVACLGMTLVSLFIINHFTGNFNDSIVYKQWASRAYFVLAFALAICVLTQLLYDASSQPSSGTSSQAKVNTGLSILPSPSHCVDAVSQGRWVQTPCDTSPTIGAKHNKVGFCRTDRWLWSSTDCPVQKLSTSKLRSVFKGKRITFVGDSMVRNVYHSFVSLLEPSYQQNFSSIGKHSDFQFLHPAFDDNLEISFKWAPHLKDVTATTLNILSSVPQQQQSSPQAQQQGGNTLLVSGAACWDALVGQDLANYTNELQSFADRVSPQFALRNNSLSAVWLLPTAIQTDRLTTLDKKTFMNEQTVASYRSAFTDSRAAASFDAVINTVPASKGRETVDGLHYSSDVYSVIAQMVANGYMLQTGVSALTTSKKAVVPYEPKVTGSMSLPMHGAAVLVLAFVMIFTMDSFLGIGFISLLLAGRSADWDAAYGPLHRKIAGSSSAPSTTNAFAGNTTGEKRGDNSSNSDDNEPLLRGSNKA